MSADFSVAGKKHLRDDLLHPGGAGLRISRNDNIVVPKLEVVPDRGVYMLVVHLPGLLRPGDIHRGHSLRLRRHFFPARTSATWRCTDSSFRNPVILSDTGGALAGILSGPIELKVLEENDAI